jgi:signal transduction histidine kinase
MGTRAASVTTQGDDETAARRASSSSRVDATIDALWLATLQTICGRAAHELRGSLNAVAVNLEVVRSRAEKPDVPASALAQYANVASGQLEGLISMTEALMFLVRPGRIPVDLGIEVARVVALLAPAARTAERAIELDSGFGGLGTTSASSSSVRLAIGHCSLAAADASSEVRCVAEVGGAFPRLRLEHGGARPSIDGAVVEAIESAGIDVRAEPTAVVITFPR